MPSPAAPSPRSVRTAQEPGSGPIPAEERGGATHSAATGGAPTLVVDVDGTLLRTDLLWEGIMEILQKRPVGLFGLIGALRGGRSGFKEYVARKSDLDIRILPFEPVVLELMEKARTEGRRVVLASGAHESQVEALAREVEADAGWGSDGSVSLTGKRKLERIRAAFPNFDYVGNSRADLPLWKGARRGLAMNAPRGVIRRARRSRPDLVVLNGSRSPWNSWFRALRPHQWSKNALLLLPALAAHLPWTFELASTLLLGFLSFSAVASAVYLINDVLDLRSDRLHATKRNRPIAAGEISIPGALAGACGLLVLAGLLSLALPTAFQAVVGLYFVGVLAYSLGLKRYAVLDVIVLASLYTARVVAGAALVSVPLSRWFIAFSVFFFLSLALVKRVVELREVSPGEEEVSGRGYVTADLAVLRALGTAAAAGSALVYCLYITDASVGELYRNPDLLWFGFPMLLYWQARVWLLTARGEMHHDPVVFALRDRASYLALGAFLLMVWIAA